MSKSEKIRRSEKKSETCSNFRNFPYFSEDLATLVTNIVSSIFLIKRNRTVKSVIPTLVESKNVESKNVEGKMSKVKMPKVKMSKVKNVESKNVESKNVETKKCRKNL